ncbi:MAG: MFS transporter [Clostridia bacterium]|nr:MFS transporter [Clostridia bacterium]
MRKFHSFREMKSFLLLWLGQSVSTLGSSLTSYALILWVYEKNGSASSIAMLSFFTYLPSILFCFFAGALADRWDKKRLMLAADSVAALGTLSVLILHGMNALQIGHLYAVNFVISLMNAFQNPAANVVVSLLTPKEQYARANGLQSLSNSAVTLLTPALATALSAFGGLRTVLIVDLITFAFAFLTLALLIPVPKLAPAIDAAGRSVWRECGEGMRFLREHRVLLRVILFFAWINLLAYLASCSLLPALILSRTGGNEAILGAVSTAMGVGTLLGSVAVTMMRPAKRRGRVIFLSCGLSFLIGDLMLAVTRGVPAWIAAMLLGNFPLPFLNANLTAIMREQVPIDMQGRVFSARDTLQFFTIPLGLLLGGQLADRVFEPMMAGTSPLAQALQCAVGAGAGSGVAVMFLITGLLGALTSFAALFSARFRALDE